MVRETLTSIIVQMTISRIKKMLPRGLKFLSEEWMWFLKNPSHLSLFEGSKWVFVMLLNSLLLIITEPNYHLLLPSEEFLGLPRRQAKKLRSPWALLGCRLTSSQDTSYSKDASLGNPNLEKEKNTKFLRKTRLSENEVTHPWQKEKMNRYEC